MIPRETHCVPGQLESRISASFAAIAQDSGARLLARGECTALRAKPIAERLPSLDSVPCAQGQKRWLSPFVQRRTVCAAAAGCPVAYGTNISSWRPTTGSVPLRKLWIMLRALGSKNLHCVYQDRLLPALKVGRSMSYKTEVQPDVPTPDMLALGVAHASSQCMTPSPHEVPGPAWTLQ